MFDEDGLCFYITRRIFDDDPNESKYTTYRNRAGWTLISPDEGGQTIVLTEDFLSAIKCGRIMPASPLFGTNISDLQLANLLLRRFNRFIIFLDDDNPQVKARQLVLKNRLEQFGEVKLLTGIGKDPKECTDKELKEILYGP